MLDVVSINTEGETYHLRPSVQALVDLERAMDKKLLRLLMDVEASGDFGISDVVEIFYHGLKYGSGEIPRKEVMELIEIITLPEAIKNAGEFLVVGLQGPKKNIPPHPGG